MRDIMWTTPQAGREAIPFLSEGVEGAPLRGRGGWHVEAIRNGFSTPIDAQGR